MAPFLIRAVEDKLAKGEPLQFDFVAAVMPIQPYFWAFQSIGERGGDQLLAFLLSSLQREDPRLRSAASNCFRHNWLSEQRVDDALALASQRESDAEAKQQLEAVIQKRRSHAPETAPR